MREIALSRWRAAAARVGTRAGRRVKAVRAGLPKLRAEGSVRAAMVEDMRYLQSSAEATQARVRTGVRDAFVEMPDGCYPHLPPLRARTRECHALHYARRGRDHRGDEYRAHAKECPRNSCATRSPAGAPILPANNQSPGDRADDHRRTSSEDQCQHREQCGHVVDEEEVEKLRWSTLWGADT